MLETPRYDEVLEGKFGPDESKFLVNVSEPTVESVAGCLGAVIDRRPW